MFAALFKKASPWDMFEEGKKSWQDFNAREQEAIIRNYMPKVRYLAQKQKSRVPAHIEYNDLLSAGMMGLMEALGKFRPEQIFCPLNAQALNFVDVLAAAIVAFSRQSLRVFVGKDRTHGRNHRRRSKILRSN